MARGTEGVGWTVSFLSESFPSESFPESGQASGRDPSQRRTGGSAAWEEERFGARGSRKGRLASEPRCRRHSAERHEPHTLDGWGGGGRTRERE